MSTKEEKRDLESKKALERYENVYRKHAKEHRTVNWEKWALYTIVPEVLFNDHHEYRAQKEQNTDPRDSYVRTLIEDYELMPDIGKATIIQKLIVFEWYKDRLWNQHFAEKKKMF